MYHPLLDFETPGRSGECHLPRRKKVLRFVKMMPPITLDANRDTLNSGLSDLESQDYLRFILTLKSLPTPQTMLCN